MSFFQISGRGFFDSAITKAYYVCRKTISEKFLSRRNQKVLNKFRHSWPKAEHSAAKYQHVRQNYTPRAQENSLKRSFLMEDFFSDFKAWSTALESLLFWTLAQRFGNVLIIAFYKPRGTTWWRENFNKQSTNRFLISSDTEKKASNFRQKTIALAYLLKLHPKRPVDQFQEKNPSKDIILFLHIGAPYLVFDQNFPKIWRKCPGSVIKTVFYVSRRTIWGFFPSVFFIFQVF